VLHFKNSPARSEKIGFYTLPAAGVDVISVQLEALELYIEPASVLALILARQSQFKKSRLPGFGISSTSEIKNSFCEEVVTTTFAILSVINYQPFDIDFEKGDRHEN